MPGAGGSASVRPVLVPLLVGSLLLQTTPLAYGMVMSGVDGPSLDTEPASGATLAASGGGRSLRSLVQAIAAPLWHGAGRIVVTAEQAIAALAAAAPMSQQEARASSFVPVLVAAHASTRAETGEAPAARYPQQPPSPPERPAAPATVPAPTAAPRAQAAAASTSAIALLPGWNLVSFPNEPPDTSPAALFAPIAGSFTQVWAYDVCDAADPWKLYDPADPAASDLTAIDERIGLWIEATAAASLPSPGTQPPTTTIHLCPGWNLIGYPLEQARPVPTALASIEPKYERVYGYDGSTPADVWSVWSRGVPAWANDLTAMQPGRGYWVLATEETDLVYSNAGPPPEVAITAPGEVAVLFAPTDVTGTVVSDLLQGWTLAYRRKGGAADTGEWTTIATGTTPVTNAVLGRFDTTLLQNGMYELRLEATDLSGQSTSVEVRVVVAGQQKIGHFSLSFVDLEIPVAGLPLQVVRTYDSRDTAVGDFGHGWTLDIRQGSYRNNRKPGLGWQIVSQFLPCQAVGETLAHLTTIRLSDRELYRFKAQLASPATTAGGCFAKARFDFVDGPVPGATLAILGNDDVFYANGTNQVVDADTFEVYEPRAVRLATRDGRSFDLDLDAGVTRLADLDGNVLSIGPQSISHDAGVGVVFERDAAGRITRVSDPEGDSLTYSYDAAGDLVTVTDQESRSTRFTYGARHFLLDLEDARGVKPLRNEYDASGRLVRHIDAFGKEILYTHDLAGRREIVTDRLGHSRELVYDEHGNVVRETDAQGNVTLRTFDARDNLLTEANPLGHTTTYTYTAANDVATVTDPEGGVTRYSYDGRGNVLTTSDPRGKVTTNTFDANGHLLTTTDPTGAVTTYTYTTRGNLATETDAEGGVTRYGYDQRGNLTSETDALGTVTTSTYDTKGNRRTQSTTRTTPQGPETLTWTHGYDRLSRLVSTTDPDGSVTRTEYDPTGQVSASVDKLARRTSFTYDQLGRQTGTTYPDGTSDARTYDAEGRLLATTDRGGRTTTYAYSATGQLLQTAYPGGATTTSVYDAANRLIESRNARSHPTRYAYDRAGRRTKVTDALGFETLFAYDSAGNQTAVTNAAGNTTSLEHDDAGRLVRTVYPDGTARTVTYDRKGRRIAETDQAGITTQFGFDALDRLVTVTDALAQVARYAYDEQGNRVSQTDANGRVTRFEHDRLGRQTKRVLPDGAAETMAFDAAGNLITRVRFGGAVITQSFDANNRLVQRTYPGGTAHAFTYTSTGQRATATDGRGVTLYDYDQRGRLVRMATPDGRELRYAYDPQSNRTELTARVGAETLTTRYAYDALDRLETVTDPTGRAYVHGYDPNGNRAALAHPNGVATTYQYDPLDRLRQIETTAPGAGGVIARYAYTLGAAGNRTAVAEHDGTVRSYSYDQVCRLTSETVSGAAGEQYRRVFAYDPVGNRLTQAHRDGGEGGAEATKTYGYDVRDRLVTEDALAYTWDVDGRLVGKSGADGASYTWDFEDRLNQVTLADGTVVRHTYDADGVRVRTETTPAGGGAAEVTDYLVDTSGPLSQVVVEGQTTAAVGALYVRGDDLLAVVRGAVTRFYHADGLGSVRTLTDEAGELTDRYAFSAFGELLSHSGDDPQGYLFAGEMLDPNVRWYYNRARWMDPAVGRFASIDPLEGLDEQPAALHKYMYAGANPTTSIDPTGLITITQLLALAFVGRRVHALIGDDFVGESPATRTANYFSIASILGISARACVTPRACRLKPDLVERGPLTGEVYEIKPRGLFTVGFLQNLAYINLLTINDPLKRAWGPGFDYEPPPKLFIPERGGWDVFVSKPIMGVILYTANSRAITVAAIVASIVTAGFVSLGRSVAIAGYTARYTG